MTTSISDLDLSLPQALAAGAAVAVIAGAVAGIPGALTVVACTAGALVLFRLAVRRLRVEARVARLEVGHADRAAAAMREANAQVHGRVRQMQERTHTLEREAESLRKRENAAQEAHRFKCDFLDHVSHELRTPLNAVIGFADLVLEDARPDQVDQLRNVLAGGRSMLKLVNQMLDLARVDAGGVTLEEIEAAALVGGAATSASMLAGSRGVELRTRAPDDVRLRCDVSKLRQVLDSLLVTAIESSPARASVQVSALRRGPLVRFSVEDSGAGLDHAALTQLFQPFTGSALVQGAGVEMAVCRRIVELHGGAIEVASKPGHGCTVSFTLPAIA